MNKAHTAKLKREYLKAHPLADPLKVEMMEGEELAGDGDYDSEAWLRNRTAEADKALILACKRGSPSALKLLYQLLDRLTEKTEHKVELGLSAAEHIGIAREADRRIQEASLGTDGSAGLLKKP